MIGITIGSAVAIGSGYIISNSYEKSKLIDKSKNDLINSTVPFKDINQQHIGSRMMTVIDNTKQAGVLEVLMRTISYDTHRINNSDGSLKQFGVTARKSWESCGLNPINLNMGIPSFVPPQDLTNILGDDDSISVITGAGGSTKALVDTLHQNFGVKFGLQNSGTYKAQFLSLEKKKVYALGNVSSGQTNGIKYEAELMGTNKQQIVDKAFEDQTTENTLVFVGGVFGFVCGTGLAVASAYGK